MDKKMRLTLKEAAKLGIKLPGKQSKNKYGAIKTVIDGIKFDSRKEANVYCDLKQKKRSGEIKEIELQPEFVLLDGFDYHGQRIRAIKYHADFRVTYADGRVVVIDVKGGKATQTRDYVLRKKMLLHRYRDIEFEEW